MDTKNSIVRAERWFYSSSALASLGMAVPPGHTKRISTVLLSKNIKFKKTLQILILCVILITCLVSLSQKLYWRIFWPL